MQELVDKIFVRPSISHWKALVLFVTKKDNILRLCIDYRQLTKTTILNEYPLPQIDGLFHRLHNAKVLSKIDSRCRYHQLIIKEFDIPKTTFETWYWQLRVSMMLFELTNAPMTFIGVMNHVFSPYLNQFVVMFIDDILIYPKK